MKGKVVVEAAASKIENVNVEVDGESLVSPNTVENNHITITSIFPTFV